MASRKKSVRTAAKKRPNILLFAIDSLLATHMSCYGYPRLTTPHIDKFAAQGTLFERTYSPHVPTTPAYSSMLTGRDCFGTEVVALRHQGPLTPKVKTLAEICRKHGYTTTCVGFGWNPASRGFDKYLEFPGWGSWDAGRSPKAQNLNDVTQPEIDRLRRQNEELERARSGSTGTSARISGQGFRSGCVTPGRSWPRTRARRPRAPTRR